MLPNTRAPSASCSSDFALSLAALLNTAEPNGRRSYETHAQYVNTLTCIDGYLQNSADNP